MAYVLVCDNKPVVISDKKYPVMFKLYKFLTEQTRLIRNYQIWIGVRDGVKIELVNLDDCIPFYKSGAQDYCNSKTQGPKDYGVGVNSFEWYCYERGEADAEQQKSRPDLFKGYKF